ncbi:hypothetical protein L1987_25224 [Smallanthus sonchifolius]|uniref:Uncharacterized protein n=1 Tax=Smallanthus sonchifolius TaxID=185202 RepID=A0ACB9INY6_9ASTR|nr:hypothetical protein L1987_25224 [Smallanthus sonchifolius]
MLPESYISSRSDEASRTLEKSFAVYDMDYDDEQWLKKSNHECVSEDVFEKVIDAFERGIYYSPHDYSEAASAVDRCLGLASKEVLEDVYSYWMTKRKKKRSALIRVFKRSMAVFSKQKRVKRHFTTTVLRKKRSFRRRASQRLQKSSLILIKLERLKPNPTCFTMLNDEKLLEESTKAYIKVHETQEAAKRSEESSIVKRQKAQTLMEAADLAIYRATMALRIAEALAAGGSVDLVAGATFGSLVD